jgi:hypothetical protein
MKRRHPNIENEILMEKKVSRMQLQPEHSKFNH